MTVADDLLPHALGKALLADTAYDADDFVREIRRAGMKPVIPCNPTRKHRRRRLDKKLYRYRYLVEVFFHQIKRCRAVATRYEKTARNYLAVLHLACAWCWLQ